MKESNIKKSLHNEISQHSFPKESNIEQIIKHKKNKRKKSLLIAIPIFSFSICLFLIFGLPTSDVPKTEQISDDNSSEIELFNVEDSADAISDKSVNETRMLNSITKPEITWSNQTYINNGYLDNPDKLGTKLGYIKMEDHNETEVYSIKGSEEIAIFQHNQWVRYNIKE